jgi:translation initiation factor IF-1
MENQTKITFLFNRIKKAHTFYKAGDNDLRSRLFDACEPIFKELEVLGVERSFTESLLVFGKEFVASLTDEDTRPATLAEAEEIFGAKAEPLTDKEMRAARIAEKHGINVYRILPGEEVKIEALGKKSSKTGCR